MSAGTEIIQNALKHLSVHSSLQPAPPEAIVDGMGVLNSMRAYWEDEWDIKTGMVPLQAPGDELSEPLGIKNDLEYCLAIALQPKFPMAKISPLLPGLANKGFENIRRVWGTVTIPKVQPRRTLPKGQGNKQGGAGRWTYTFFPEGSEIG